MHVLVSTHVILGYVVRRPTFRPIGVVRFGDRSGMTTEQGILFIMARELIV